MFNAVSATKAIKRRKHFWEWDRFGNGVILETGTFEVLNSLQVDRSQRVYI